MSSDKKGYLQGVITTVIFGLLVNLISSYFEQNWPVGVLLVLMCAAIVIGNYRQEIRTSLAKRSIISKQKRMGELQIELETFNRICLEVENSTNRYILIVLRRFILPFSFLIFCLFSRISIGSVITILLGTPKADLFDLMASLQAALLIALAFFLLGETIKGWSFIKRIVYPDEYRARIQKEIDWLATKLVQPPEITKPEKNE